MAAIEKLISGWPVIKAAPVTVIGLCALFAASGFGVATFAYTREISTVNAENESYRGDIERLKGENGSKERPFESRVQCPPGSFVIDNMDLRAKGVGVQAEFATPCIVNSNITAGSIGVSVLGRH